LCRKKLAGIVVVVLASIIASTSAQLVQAQLADSPWPKFMRDIKNTGRSPYTGPRDNTMRWIFLTDGWIASSPAIGKDGTIYFGTWAGENNKFYAINSDGTIKWTYPVNGAIWPTPAISADGTVYFGVSLRENKLYAIRDDGDRATVKWSLETSEPIYTSPTIASDGTIYFGTTPYENKLYAIRDDGDRATVKWLFQSYGYITLSPAIGSDGTVYVSSGENLYALRDDGGRATVKWIFNSEDGPISTPPAIGDDNTVHVGSLYGKLYALYENGSEKWSQKVGEGTDSPIAIGTDGTVYVSQYDNDMNTWLYAISPDGTRKWIFQAERFDILPPTVAFDNVIYFISRKTLYALNSDGTLRWSYSTAKELALPTTNLSPSISSDGILYVAGKTSDGSNALYAFGPVPTEQPLPTWLTAVFIVIPLLALLGAFFYYRKR